MNPNLPRENIVWHPTINYDACLSDRACLDFCQNKVFVWDDEKNHPIVQSPLNCVVGCDAAPRFARLKPSRSPARTNCVPR